jgi:hypothetical protein
MEVNSSQPFTIREIGTNIDFVIIIEIKNDLVTRIGIEHFFGTRTKIKTNIIEVEEVVSLVDPTPKSMTLWHKILFAQLFNRL